MVAAAGHAAVAAKTVVSAKVAVAAKAALSEGGGSLEVQPRHWDHNGHVGFRNKMEAWTGGRYGGYQSAEWWDRVRFERWRDKRWSPLPSKNMSTTDMCFKSVQKHVRHGHLSNTYLEKHFPGRLDVGLELVTSD